MKTDRELLELAARAAGIEIVDWSCIEESCDAIARLEYRHLHKWNPLTDDGDALRLAVKLKLLVDCHSALARPLPDSLGWYEAYPPSADNSENTRRAIVRAAAAIGETL